LESLRDRRAFVHYLEPLKKRQSGSSMPSAPSPVPNRCSIMSADTLIASPFRTTVCSTSKLVK
jgi:hypothetical protein